MRIEGKLEGANIRPVSNKKNQHSAIATESFDASKSPPAIDNINILVHLRHSCLDVAQPR